MSFNSALSLAGCLRNPSNQRKCHKNPYYECYVCIAGISQAKYMLFDGYVKATDSTSLKPSKLNFFFLLFTRSR